MNFNRVLLGGRLTRDPELRYIPSGAAVCEFAIAVNRQWAGKDGEKKEEVTFVDIVTWGRQAETCSEYLKKGRPVFIEGHLTQDRWETPDGQKRNRMRVTAERVQFLGGKRDDESFGGPPSDGSQAEAVNDDTPADDVAF